MTPEEAFKKWQLDNYIVETEWGNPEQNITRMAWKAAWLEATRQAYEDAIQIAELSASEEDSGRFRDACFAIAQAIRQRMKEYDNEKTQEP